MFFWGWRTSLSAGSDETKKIFFKGRKDTINRSERFGSGAALQSKMHLFKESSLLNVDISTLIIGLFFFLQALSIICEQTHSVLLPFPTSW